MDKDNEENIWTKFAKSYDIVLRNLDIYQQLKERVVSAVKDAQILLDAGCGTGIIAIEMARLGKKAYGIDNNHYMLAQAIENSKGIDNIFLGSGDVSKLEFESEFFDAVILNNVLFYVNDPIKALSEAHRVVKPGGTMVLSGPVPKPDMEKLASHTAEYLKKIGKFEELKEHYSHFLQCSMELKKNGMPNVYSAEPLSQMLLKEIGFSKIIEADNRMYLGECYFVVAEK
jgi:ubiquinone/menaquinone biosynthesis C-methylase UbiE